VPPTPLFLPFHPFCTGLPCYTYPTPLDFGLPVYCPYPLGLPLDCVPFARFYLRLVAWFLWFPCLAPYLYPLPHIVHTPPITILLPSPHPLYPTAHLVHTPLFVPQFTFPLPLALYFKPQLVWTAPFTHTPHTHICTLLFVPSPPFLTYPSLLPFILVVPHTFTFLGCYVWLPALCYLPFTHLFTPHFATTHIYILFLAAHTLTRWFGRYPTQHCLPVAFYLPVYCHVSCPFTRWTFTRCHLAGSLPCLTLPLWVHCCSLQLHTTCPHTLPLRSYSSPALGLTPQDHLCPLPTPPIAHVTYCLPSPPLGFPRR